MSVDEFRRVADALGAEPLFHMSLGSKELFHSNLLGYYAERFPDFADAVFSDLASPNSALTTRAVHREKGHLDLVLELPSHNPVVIENKVFSLPDEIQLERYSGDAVTSLPGQPHLVLLSLADPHWQDNQFRTSTGATWHFLGYGDLRARLADSAEHVAGGDGYLAMTLDRYLRLLDALQELSRLVKPAGPDDPLELPKQDVKALATARIHDSARKLRASHIIRELRTRAGWAADFWAKSNFTNGATLLEAFAPFGDGDHVGWQYQGGQFRLALILNSLEGRGAQAKKLREERARELITWFDFTLLGDVLGVDPHTLIPLQARVGPDGFNHYDPQFVYRYRKTPSLTVGQLTEIGTRYIERAQVFAQENPA